jgi:hypothetical protein
MVPVLINICFSKHSLDCCKSFLNVSDSERDGYDYFCKYFITFLEEENFGGSYSTILEVILSWLPFKIRSSNNVLHVEHLF